MPRKRRTKNKDIEQGERGKAGETKGQQDQTGKGVEKANQ